MMIKRSMSYFKNKGVISLTVNQRFAVKRFYSSKDNDNYIFNKNTYKYELNLNSNSKYLSSFECFILYPFTYTKTFLSTLFK